MLLGLRLEDRVRLPVGARVLHPLEMVRQLVLHAFGVHHPPVVVVVAVIAQHVIVVIRCTGAGAGRGMLERIVHLRR